jgi:mono/diheme cytochrome c family protein
VAWASAQPPKPMNKRPFILLGVVAAICVIAIPLLALSKKGDEGSNGIEVASRDKEGMALFNTNCGACHTLAAAGTDGVVGPNLDELIGTVSAAGGKDAWTGGYNQVLAAVSCGIEGRMPRGILEEDNAKEVASFVAAYAGRLSPDQGPGVDTATIDKPDPQPCAENPQTNDNGGTQTSGNG